MENVPVKLKKPVNTHYYFEDNQVLTAAQLNNAVQYFDYQQRLTRTQLIGCGIVCGLKTSGLFESVAITKGIGITSDGDLLTLAEDKLFTQARPLDDRKAQYKVFEDFVKAGRIWELLDSTVTPTNGIVPVKSVLTQPGSKDFVVLLYSGQYLEDTDICTSNDCDNKGIVQQADLKVVLMHYDDYRKIQQSGECCSQQYFSLPDVSVPRVFLNENDSLFSYNDLNAAYITALNRIKSGSSEFIQALQRADQYAQGLFQCYEANGNVPGSNNGISDDGVLIRIAQAQFTALGLETGNFTSSGSFATKLNQLSGANQPGIQYVYDFAKEVADAYEEFKEAVFELCSGCCINPDLFPKHLSLGVHGSVDGMLYDLTRQCFIESPVLNHKDDGVLKALRLYSRMVQMIRTFAIPANAIALKITPSVSIAGQLGQRTIPSFYNAAVLFQNWNPDKTARGRTRTILSYAANGNVNVGYSPVDFVVNPLDYNIDAHDFFRIEGHLGKKYEDVLAAINALQNSKDLPFDVIGVQLQADAVNIKPVKDHYYPYWDLMFDSHVHSWNNQLQHIKFNNDDVIKVMPAETELVKEGISVKYGSPVTLRRDVVLDKNEVDTHITATRQAFVQPEFGKTNFSGLHQSMVEKGARMSKKTRLFTGAAINTPLENVGHNIHPHILDWLGDYKDAQNTKIKAGYVFSNFLKQHPSMLHNAGVCRGGTFIIVYNTVNNISTVVADFYLPYICKELVAANVPVKDIKPRDVKAIDNINFNDFIKEPLYNPNLVGVVKDLGVFQGNYVKDIKTLGDNVLVAKDLAVNTQISLNQQYNGVVRDYNVSLQTLAGSYEKVYVQPTKIGVAGVTGITAVTAATEVFTKDTITALTKEQAAEAVKKLREAMAGFKQIHGV
jgi:hypothetical protein